MFFPDMYSIRSDRIIRSQTHSELKIQLYVISTAGRKTSLLKGISFFDLIYLIYTVNISHITYFI